MAAGAVMANVATVVPASDAMAPSRRLAMGRTPMNATDHSAMIRPRSWGPA